VQQPDISSILTLSVALNFGYAFITALADREISSRMERARRFKEFSDPVLKNMRQRDPKVAAMREKDFGETYNRFLVSMREAQQSYGSIATFIIVLCLLAGVLSLILLFYLTFSAVHMSVQWKLGSAAVLAGVPLLSAPVLWLCARHKLASADAELKQLRDCLAAPY
jgi:hypothetical protein